MKPSKLILPITLSMISYNVLADELRSIPPEVIQNIESQRKLSIRLPLATSTLILGKDERGGYVFSVEKMKSAIAKVDDSPVDIDPLTSQILRELLGSSTTVQGVKIQVMKTGTQDV